MVSRTIGTVEPRISPLDAEELREQMDDAPTCEVGNHAGRECSIVAVARVRATCPQAPPAQLVCRAYVEAYEWGKAVWVCPGCHQSIGACWVVSSL